MSGALGTGCAHLLPGASPAWGITMGGHSHLIVISGLRGLIPTSWGCKD